MWLQVLPKIITGLIFALIGFSPGSSGWSQTRPNIVLLMADDMGWGETSYRQHPILRTPNLDAMAAAGLRLDRFYAGAPNCSPTRSTVMTGRSNDRVGVYNHGYALHRQEKTIAQGLKGAGYITAHFGKWHLNGYSGVGAPILATDDHKPSDFGFDQWLSVTNFFDRNPLMSRQGKFEEFQGDSSEIIVDEACKFLDSNRSSGRPMLAVVWFGSPHSPFVATQADKASFTSLDAQSQEHYGELVALDRSIGALRRRLREMEIADNTLLMFCSDNGGLPEVTPGTVGGLRGFKNTLYEGGLRVPAIIEWPAVIKQPRVSNFPAGTIDIFPTVAEIVGLSDKAFVQPIDGISILALLTAEVAQRDKPLPFRHQGRAALVDNDYKIICLDLKKDVYELYNLRSDPQESQNIASQQPAILQRLRDQLLAWNQSVENSVAGKDYVEGRVRDGEPGTRRWNDAPEYQPFLAELYQRPEYRPVPAGGAKKNLNLKNSNAKKKSKSS